MIIRSDFLIISQRFCDQYADLCLELLALFICYLVLGRLSLWRRIRYLNKFDFLLLFQYRQLLKLAASNKYVDRKQQKEAFIATQPKESYTSKPNDDIFEGNPLEKAKEISEKVKVLKDLNQQKSFKKRNLKIVNKKKSLKKQALQVERSSGVIGAKSRKKVKKNKVT